MSNNIIKLLCNIFILCCSLHITFSKEKHIIVIIPSFNNKELYERNLQSVIEQEYTNYKIIYIDDCSPDGTGNLVENFIKTHHIQDRIILIKNRIRCLAARNIYHAIHTYCKDDDIIVLLDGDDWLSQKKVLSIINEAYQDPNVWLTYGDHRKVDGTGGQYHEVPEDIIKNNKYRTIPWCISHPKTFYAWLYKLIKLEDLLYQGTFFPMAWDLAKIYPMLEMSHGKFKYIKDNLYTYYTQGLIHDFKLNGKFQHLLGRIIWEKKPYLPLSIPIKKYSQLAESFSCSFILFSNLPKEECLFKLKKLLPTIPEISKIYICNQNHTPQVLHIGSVPVKFIPAPKNVNTLCRYILNEHTHTEDYCLIANDTIFSDISINLAHSVKLLRQTEGFTISYAKYLQGKKQKLENTTFFKGNTFTFQLQWKPQLLYPYKEFAHLFLTKDLKKYWSINNLLFDAKLQLQAQLDSMVSQKAGLIIISK